LLRWQDVLLMCCAREQRVFLPPRLVLVTSDGSEVDGAAGGGDDGLSLDRRQVEGRVAPR
jgi:hypothetical protein